MTTFNNYIEQYSSKKTTLVHLYGVERVFAFDLESGSIYSKTPKYFVSGVKINGASQTSIANSSVSSGQFFYDVVNNKLYIYSTDIDNDRISVTYKFFYASSPLDLSHDLQNYSEPVNYEPRVSESPGFSSNAGVDNNATSVTGTGRLTLENNDLGLNTFANSIIFENQLCEVFSYNIDLPASEAKIIYRGLISSMSLSQTRLTFTIKDLIFNIKTVFPSTIFTESDTNSKQIQGKYKRTVYGKVQGLRGRSLDSVGEFFTLTGTIQGNFGETLITGSGTTFLSELSIGDTLVAGSFEFNISDITSDTTLNVTRNLSSNILFNSVQVRPSTPLPTRNRTWTFSEHKLSEEATTVTEIKQLNRIKVASPDFFDVGDSILVQGNPQNSLILRKSGDQLVLASNLQVEPAIGATVQRVPIQKVYVSGSFVDGTLYTTSNTNSGASVTFNSDLEFDIALERNIPGATLTFTNGSRTITGNGNVDLTRFVENRDFIRPSSEPANYYEILDVEENQIRIRTPFLTATTSEASTYKNIDIITETSIVTTDAIGKADSTGRLISTIPGVVKDILTQSNIPTQYIDEASFDYASERLPQTVSLTIPETFDGNPLQSKTIIDRLNKAVNGSVSQNTDLNIQYALLDASIKDYTDYTDKEIISWWLKGNFSDIYTQINSSYNLQDSDNTTLEPGKSVFSFTASDLEDIIDAKFIKEFDFNLSETKDVEILTKRQIYNRCKYRNDIEIRGDLRLFKVNIGDIMLLDFKELPPNFGLPTTNKKFFFVYKVVRTGEKVTLSATDLGELFNRTARLTEIDAVNWDVATDDEKILNGYLTDTNGTVNNDDDTFKINKIG